MSDETVDGPISESEAWPHVLGWLKAHADAAVGEWIERLVAHADALAARAEKAEAERDALRDAVLSQSLEIDDLGTYDYRNLPDGSVIVGGKVWRWKTKWWGPLNSKGERWIEGVAVPLEDDDE